MAETFFRELREPRLLDALSFFFFDADAGGLPSPRRRGNASSTYVTIASSASRRTDAIRSP